LGAYRAIFVFLGMKNSIPKRQTVQQGKDLKIKD